MTSFTRMRWAGAEPISTPTPDSTPAPESGAVWARVRKLLTALERERVALEGARIGSMRQLEKTASVDYETLRRERRLARRVSNFKWLCLGSGASWVAFLLLSF